MCLALLILARFRLIKTRWPETVRMRLMTVVWLAFFGFTAATLGCAATERSDASQAVDTAPTEGADSQVPGVDNAVENLLIQPEPAADLGFRLGWASPVPLLPGQAITSVTALGDMIVVVESPTNTVTALRTSNGELLWKTVLGSDLESLFAPSRDGRQLFIHSATRIFTLDTRDGAVTAVAPLLSTVDAPAVYSPTYRLAYMSGVNGLVFAHSVDSNFSRWRYKMANRISSSVAMAGQDVFIADNGGTYAMVEASSGAPLWRNRTLGPVNTQPVVQDSEVIVASADGKLYAINRTTGNDTWQYLGGEQPLNESPVVLGRLIILPLPPDNGIVAVDAINGEELWRADVDATPVLSRQRDMLLYTDAGLVTIDLNTGNIIKQAQTKTLMKAIPVAGDGSILLVSPEGRLLRLSPI